MFKNILIQTIFLTAFSANVVIAQKAMVTNDNKKTAASVLAKNIIQLSTYQADFEQRVHDESGREIDFSSGTFSIQKPNHFRWEVKQKFAQLIVADGDHLWTYDQDLEQVTIQNQSKILANSPLLLLTSDASELSQLFDITQVPLTDKPEAQLFQLRPKQEDGEGVFESISVLFEQGKMAELLMNDSLGQQTSVKFLKAQLNLKLKAELFSFSVPEGVDIVDSREKITAE